MGLGALDARAARFCAACLTAAMAAAASRPWGLESLAVVSYAPAFLAIWGASGPREAALLAFVASLGLNSVAYEAAQGLFPGGHAAAAAVASVPYLFVGALVSIACRRALRGGAFAPIVLRVLLTPSLWAAAEWLPSRPELLGTFALPLGLIGYSQVDSSLGRLAGVGSVALVSQAVLHLSALVATAARATAARPAGAAAFAVAAIGAAALAAPSGEAVTWQATRGPGTVSGSAGSAASSAMLAGGATSLPSAGLDVLLLQPALPDHAYLAPARSRAAARSLERLLGSLVPWDGRSPAPDLVVTPEAAWPGPLKPPYSQHTAAVRSAFPSGATVLIGAPGRGALTAGGPTNSVFIATPTGVRHLYAKRRLVPIGEAGLDAGPGAVVTSVADVELAPLVCYDALFPSDAREAVRRGARLLVVVTDDAFAAGSDVPALHLRAARMRAIELGVPLVLASNTGPSAVVAADGSVVASLPALHAGALRERVAPGEGKTPYVALGDVAPLANLVLSALGALGALRGGRPVPVGRVARSLSWKGMDL